MTNLVSIKLEIPYAGTIVTEIRTFRPESLVHITVINGTLVTLTANVELTGLTVLTTNTKEENTVRGEIYLPFPLLDINQEPYQIPGLFKLSLKTQTQMVKVSTAKAETAKAETAKAETAKAETAKAENAKDVRNDFVTVSSHKSALLKGLFSSTDKSVEKVNLPKILADYILSEESFNSHVGDFKCELYTHTQYKSCLALSRKKPKITLCLGCRGKISINPEYNCAYNGCKFKVFIRPDGEKQNKYCNVHGNEKV